MASHLITSEKTKKHVKNAVNFLIFVEFSCELFFGCAKLSFGYFCYEIFVKTFAFDHNKF